MFKGHSESLMHSLSSNHCIHQNVNYQRVTFTDLRRHRATALYSTRYLALSMGDGKMASAKLFRVETHTEIFLRYNGHEQKSR